MESLHDTADVHEPEFLMPIGTDRRDPTQIRRTKRVCKDRRFVVRRSRLHVSVRAWTISILLALYAGLTVCILIPSSPVLTLDHYFAGLHLMRHHPAWRIWINRYVMFGQRLPATIAVLPFFAWAARRVRSTRPLVQLGLAVGLLNLTVGIIKCAVGRVGPWHLPGRAVHDIFAGGDIYPSGHVSNAVVLYGLVAWVIPRFRNAAIGVAVFLSVTVGLGTIYLRTHWFSDVVGGWLAGSLVLLSLPSLMPQVQRGADRLAVWVTRRYRRLRSSRRNGFAPVTPKVRDLVVQGCQQRALAEVAVRVKRASRPD